MAQPANVATPAVTVNGFVVHDNVAPPAVVRFNVTALLSDVTTLPPASSTVTAGCVVNAVPPVESDGWVLNTSCAGSPTETTMSVLSVVSAPSDAVTVQVPV